MLRLCTNPVEPLCAGKFVPGCYALVVNDDMPEQLRVSLVSLKIDVVRVMLMQAGRSLHFVRWHLITKLLRQKLIRRCCHDTFGLRSILYGVSL